jgi:hypothetical protein
MPPSPRAAVAAYYKAAPGLGIEADAAWDGLQHVEYAMDQVARRFARTP